MKIKLIVILSIAITILFALQWFLGQNNQCEKCLETRLKIETAVASKGLAASLLAQEFDAWGNKFLLGNLDNDKFNCKVILSFGSDGKLGGLEIHQRDIFQVFDCRNKNIVEK